MLGDHDHTSTKRHLNIEGKGGTGKALCTTVYYYMLYLHRVLVVNVAYMGSVWHFLASSCRPHYRQVRLQHYLTTPLSGRFRKEFARVVCCNVDAVKPGGSVISRKRTTCERLIHFSETAAVVRAPRHSIL